jgi:hypothetical protein
LSGADQGNVPRKGRVALASALAPGTAAKSDLQQSMRVMDQLVFEAEKKILELKRER